MITFSKICLEPRCSFIEVTSGTGGQSKYVGVAEQYMRALRKAAKDSAPCVILFDEIDSVLYEPGDAETRPPTGEYQTCFEPDGLAADGIVVIVTTNFPDRIARAIKSRLGTFLFGPFWCVK